MAPNEIRSEISCNKGWMIQNGICKIRIGDQPLDMIPVQGMDERFPGFFPGLTSHHHFGQHGIIIDADQIAGFNACVHPDMFAPG